ncbi:unnamed protein product [Lactuca saligna]|uniref:Uncharacterized protein n=1 Tax=Lactuca saligna TaxID=75948 RepID=A0AA36A0I8_LACSI|nr:unnamed protein product [Lactuca saligna]
MYTKLDLGHRHIIISAHLLHKIFHCLSLLPTLSSNQVLPPLLATSSTSSLEILLFHFLPTFYRSLPSPPSLTYVGKRQSLPCSPLLSPRTPSNLFYSCSLISTRILYPFQIPPKQMHSGTTVSFSAAMCCYMVLKREEWTAIMQIKLSFYLPCHLLLSPPLLKINWVPFILDKTLTKYLSGLHATQENTSVIPTHQLLDKMPEPDFLFFFEIYHSG